METLVHSLCAPDAPSGAPMPPRFRPGMSPSRHRAFYGAMRNARERRDAHRRHATLIYRVLLLLINPGYYFGTVRRTAGSPTKL